MGSLLQIRDVPEETRRALKARAAARGQSLNSYLLDLVSEDVARPTVAEVLQRAASHAERAVVSAQEVIKAARAERDQQLTGRAVR
ncbi:MAG: FitA-like ribbon-helix-helix domain-containing protein [Actinomycetes bacterium]